MEINNLKKLFSINLKHNKSPNKSDNSFSFSATPSCTKVLESFNLHFKEQVNGFKVIAECFPEDANGNYELKQPINNKTKISIAAFTRDQKFFEKADLPYHQPGEYVYYLNNLDKTSSRTKVLLKGFPLKETERVNLHNLIFEFEIVKKNSKVLLPVVKDSYGKLVDKLSYEIEIDDIKNIVKLNLENIGEGFYTIDFNNKKKSYYCINSSFIREIPLIIFEVFIDDTLDPECQVVKIIDGKQVIDSKDFTTELSEKVPYWRYKIFAENFTSPITINVKSEESNISFMPESEKLSKKDPFVYFTSEYPIELETNNQYSLYRLVCSDDDDDDDNNDNDDNDDKKYFYKLIGILPKPDKDSSNFYTEQDKYIGEVSVKIRKQNGKFKIV